MVSKGEGSRWRFAARAVTAIALLLGSFAVAGASGSAALPHWDVLAGAEVTGATTHSHLQDSVPPTSPDGVTKRAPLDLYVLVGALGLALVAAVRRRQRDVAPAVPRRHAAAFVRRRGPPLGLRPV